MIFAYSVALELLKTWAYIGLIRRMKQQHHGVTIPSGISSTSEGFGPSYSHGTGKHSIGSVLLSPMREC